MSNRPQQEHIKGVKYDFTEPLHTINAAYSYHIQKQEVIKCKFHINKAKLDPHRDHMNAIYTFWFVIQLS